jgi:hypothetical protein
MRWLGLWFCSVCLVSSANTPLLAQSGLGKNEQEALDRIARNPRRPSSGASSEEKRAYDAYIKLPLVQSGQLPASALPKGYEGLVKEPTTTDILRQNLSLNQRVFEKVDGIQSEIAVIEKQYNEIQANKQTDIANFKREVSFVDSLGALFTLAETYPLYSTDQSAQAAFDNKVTAMKAERLDDFDPSSTDAIITTQAIASKVGLSRAASLEVADQYFKRSRSLLARMNSLSEQAQELLEFADARAKAVDEIVKAEEIRQLRGDVKRLEGRITREIQDAEWRLRNR